MGKTAIEITNDQSAVIASWYGWRVPRDVKPEVTAAADAEPDSRVVVDWHGLHMTMSVDQARELTTRLLDRLSEV